MPRRSSGGRPTPRMAPRAAPLRNPPQPVAPAPPPVPIQRGPAVGGLGSAIADGLAFGTGSAIAHRAVDAVMGPRTIHHEVVPQPQAASPAVPSPMNNAVGADTCAIQSRAFQECINSNATDIGKCQFYLEMLNECRRGSGFTLA